MTTNSAARSTSADPPLQIDFSSVESQPAAGEAEPAAASGPDHAAQDYNTALPIESLAGTVPENAQELAEAHTPYDATLPPLPAGDLVKVQMTLKDMTVEIAPGTRIRMLRQGISQRFVEDEYEGDDGDEKADEGTDREP